MEQKQRWGIDVTGRAMWYEPWPVDATGAYRSPSEKEIEEIYGIVGEAVAETLLYFEQCVGDTHKLVELLNEHVIDKKFRITRDGLLDAGRWYNNEYYFYFIMFTKKLIGRYNFHFGEGKKEQLSVYHKIYEKGFLEYAPWGKDEDNNEILEHAISVNTGVLYYIEDVLKINSDLLIAFVNSVLPYKYNVNKSFYNNEAIWVTGEFINYNDEFMKILSNDQKTLYKGISYAVRNKLRAAKLFLNIPKRIFYFALKIATSKTSKLYDYSFPKIKNGEVEIIAKFNGYSAYKKCGQYQESCHINSSMSHLGAFEGATRILFKTEKKINGDVSINLNDDGIYYSINFKWKPDFIFTFKHFAIGFGINIASTLLFLGLLDIPFILIPFYFISNLILLIILIYRINSYTFLALKLAENAKESLKQLEELEKTSIELLKEKQFLEQKVAQRTVELERANDELKTLDKAKTEFFANISHELRTPLSNISLPLSLIREGRYGEDVKRGSRVFTTMWENSQRLARHIDNLLAVNKIMADRMTLERAGFDMVALAVNYLAAIESQVKLKNISLCFENSAGKELRCEADAGKMETILANLLGNAVKFTPKEGRVTLRLALEKGTEGQNILISVKDTGIGIAADKKGLLFRRFERLESATGGKYEGTGIGLSLVKDYAGLHGGNVAVESKPGKGSVFTVRIPYREAEPATKKVPAVKAANIAEFYGDGTGQEDHNRQNTAGPVILFVEDNADLRAFCCGLLHASYRVLEAVDGADALGKLAALAPGDLPELIISDVMMPGMDGRAFFEKVCADSRYRDIPFIFLTARADFNEKLESLKAGAIDYIAKPFAVAELMAKVAAVTGRFEGQKRRMEERMLDAIRGAGGKTDAGTPWNAEPAERGIDFAKYSLTEKEARIAGLLLEGYELKEIAFELEVSRRTVEKHQENIYRKLGVSSRLALFKRVRSSEGDGY